MKNKIIYVLCLIFAVVITAVVSCLLCSENGNQKIEAQNSNCELSEDMCIKFLEAGSQTAMTAAAAHRNTKMEYSLNEYISTIEKAFAQDTDFIKLFKSNVSQLAKFSEDNLKTLYPNLSDGGSMGPMLYNDSSEGFEQAEFAFLEQVVIAYCSNHQDYQPCIDEVFNKN